ncbi:MAG: ABC transporter substrate-binding protein [Burkholderiales bacterium]|nr:ABC transporter substrate-binding protein [Burkholderiales bacterium]
MPKAATVALSAALAAVLTTAHATEKFTYLTNWYAEAEHGGYYQAQATGLYKQAGLDVTIKMGGPQVNILQVMMAGQADCIMGYDVQTIQAWEQGIDAVTVAAAFQKDPVVLIARPEVKQFAELKSKTMLIGSAGMVTYWPWLKSKFGFSDQQMRPYNFNIQPFLADKNTAQQGYLASEPFSIEKEGHFKPSVFMLADQGWPPYAMTVVCSTKTLQARPQAVAAFVKASMQGWKSYLTGDPSPGNTLIKKDNPNMTDDLLAYGIGKIKETGAVLGGDAAKQGIGTITEARMKQTYDMLVAHHLLDPKKVDFKKTFSTRFVQDAKVMP